MHEEGIKVINNIVSELYPGAKLQVFASSLGFFVEVILNDCVVDRMDAFKNIYAKIDEYNANQNRQNILNVFRLFVYNTDGDQFNVDGLLKNKYPENSYRVKVADIDVLAFNFDVSLSELRFCLKKTKTQSGSCAKIAKKSPASTCGTLKAQAVIGFVGFI